MTNEQPVHVLTSPLAAWVGEITLPHPDQFSGAMWQVWKDAINAPKRKAYAMTHLYCYAGLELIDRFGTWKLELPLGEVQAWENRPDDERIKLVAWVGRSLMAYMDSIVDPKE